MTKRIRKPGGWPEQPTQPGGEDRYVRTWRDLEIFLEQYNGRSGLNDQSIK